MGPHAYPCFLVMGKAGLYIKQRTVYCRPNRGNRLAGVRAPVCWQPAVVAGRAAHVPSCSCPELGRIPAWPPATQANDALLAALAIRKRIRFLDVASGTGYLAAAASARGANVLGIDFAAAMVELATRPNPELTFKAGSAEDLPFASGTFDAVGCNFGMHHFPHPEKALAEASRVLRAGGRIAFTVWASRD
jgi:SAM-dependent methyltransferase